MLARWSRSSPGMVSCSIPYVSVNLSILPSYLDSIIQSFLPSLQPPILWPAHAPPPLDLQWLPLHSLRPIQMLLAIPVGSCQMSQVSLMLHSPLSHTHCSCSSAHLKVWWGQSQAHQEECTCVNLIDVLCSAIYILHTHACNIHHVLTQSKM